MSLACHQVAQRVRYELRFQPLQAGVTALSFPCDACGRVGLDDLSERARRAYFYARAVMGRDYAAPCIAPVTED